MGTNNENKHYIVTEDGEKVVKLFEEELTPEALEELSNNKGDD